MVQATEETLFQQRPHFNKVNEHGLGGNYFDPNQDDYFIIGPTNKFAPSIAYRNCLKYRRRSASLRHQDSLGHLPNQQGPGNNLKKLKIDHGNHRRHYKRESAQTEDPRKVLEEEIRRIRAELEQRKHSLKNVETTSQSPPQNAEPYESSELKLNLEDSPVITGSHKTPQAPRAARKKGTLEYIVAPNIENKRRRKSSSPLAQPRLTEYQRAYKAPEITSVHRRPQTAQSEFQTAFKASSYHGQIDIFETEYAREYKPFRYVPVDKLNTSFIRDPNVNIVPIPRPKSASILVRAQQPEDKTNGYPRSRPETSQPNLSKKIKSHESRYTSEYGAKYHSYFGLQPNSNGPTEWMRVLEGIRNQADLYRKRDLESHFTRDHLVQLASAFVDYWDQPSSDRCARNREKFLTILAQPPAGKPSELCSEKNEEREAHATTSARRRAMMDSHHVAELLDEHQVYDPESYSSEVKLGKWFYPESTCSKGGEKNNQSQLVRQNDAQALPAHFDNQLSSTSLDIEMKKHGTAGQPSHIHRTSQQGNSLSPVSTKSIMSSATPISEPTSYTNKQRNHEVNDSNNQRKNIQPSSDYLCHSYAENHEYRSWDYI